MSVQLQIAELDLEAPEEALDAGVGWRRFTREEYYSAAEKGVFGPGERLELIRGRIVEKMTQRPPHSTAIGLGADVLGPLFGPGCHVRQQSPLTLPDDTEPEPDLLVVSGPRSQLVGRHPYPTDVLLLVEISDTTLRYDRTVKGPLYAEAGIREYWIVNLNARCLEVYRSPEPVPGDGGSFRYGSVNVYSEGDMVTPLGTPDQIVAVMELLPRFAG